MFYKQLKFIVVQLILVGSVCLLLSVGSPGVSSRLVRFSSLSPAAPPLTAALCW